jgi:hypothetical protein
MILRIEQPGSVGVHEAGLARSRQGNRDNCEHEREKHD